MSNLKEKNIQPFEEGVIQGVQVRPLKKHRDDRGWLMELFRADEIDQRIMPVMSYVSETLPGVTRGPHEHVDQTDFFCFVGPSTFRIVLWDNRPKSSSYWVRHEVLVGEENPCVVVVPEGIVHAYRNVGKKPGWVINYPNKLYAGNCRKELVDEIRHEADPNTPFRID
ncbi:MAG: dTDP-4-dehydrorhamnose 3,5-epimerase [Deltaproteobacteria bacterium RIFCSPLOWO2_02_56_12]|nr:MAG: dTDP-4-dehydrorhamnose 3,5-epimerase [Deltaproteobacteria bacterium RIFCSPLOWO2_02_56_12]